MLFLVCFPFPLLTAPSVPAWLVLDNYKNKNKIEPRFVYQLLLFTQKMNFWSLGLGIASKKVGMGLGLVQKLAEKLNWGYIWAKKWNYSLSLPPLLILDYRRFNRGGGISNL